MAKTLITRAALKRPDMIKTMFEALLGSVPNHVNILADNREIRLGASGRTDSRIYFDGTDLIFYDSSYGATRTLTQLAAGGAASSLDATFDVGKIIDGATSNANSLQVGGTNDKLQIWEEGSNDIRIGTTTGANLSITAAGGAIDFGNETLTTTGTLTVQGITNTTTAIDSTANIQIGADSTKLTLGESDATDSYLQFDSANLEVYCSGLVEFQVSADTDDYLTISTATHVPTIGTVGTCDLNITSSSGEIGFDNENLTTTGTLDCGLITCAGIVNATTAIDSTAAIRIGADNVDLTLGASDATDSRIFFDGAGNLTFYDSALGVTVTLSTLASTSWTNPTVTGDLTITNGQFAWTDSADEVAGTFTFSNVANDGIDIVANSATTSNIVHVSSTSLTSGTGVRVDTAEATLNLGYYFEAYDTTAPATVWSVGENGATTIAGSAKGTDAIAITAGDITMTDGDIDLTDGDLDIAEGKIEVDTVTDEGSYIKRNQAATNIAVFELEATNASDDYPCLLLDHNNTGDVNACEVELAGTGFGFSVTAAAAGGRGYEFISAAGTASGFLADGTTGGAAWVGAAGTGLIQAQSDGALADVAASLVYLAYSGNAGGANQTGSCLNIVETGAASGTSYAASISTTNNSGLQIGLGATGTRAVNISGASGHTTTLVNFDGTAGANGWIGAAGTGMLHLSCDGALANAGASMIYSTYTGNTAAIVPQGSCAYFYENGTIAAGGYAVGITATGGGALNVSQAGTGYSNINVVGPTGQTATMVNIDGSTGANGFIGADEAACLKISGDCALTHANASMLNITNSGTGQAAHMGTSVRIVDTCNAGAGSYAVYISATDADTEAILIDDGDLEVHEDIELNGANAANLGNIRIGTTATHGAGNIDNTITLFNATTKPNGVLANCASVYTEAGELEGIDAGGAETTLTPHSIEGDFMINSYDPQKGYTFRAHIELILDWLVEKFPEISSYVEKIPGRAEKRPRQSNSPNKISA